MGYTTKIYQHGRFRVSVSTGNSKLGKVGNISLQPGHSCIPGAPCLKDCYAMKSYRQYPEVKNAWTGNEYAARINPDFFFYSIRLFLNTVKPRLFRIHVAGDFFSQEYLDSWLTMAKEYPETRFLAFTKRYMYNYSGKPKNVQIIFSAWPGLNMPKTRLPKAYMQDGTEKRVKTAIECPGNCETCGMCYDLSRTGLNVVFHKH